MMEKLQQELQKMKVKRVIDVATRRGDFAANLIKGLGGFEEIVGIDIDEKALAVAREALAFEPGVRFETADAYHTGYDAGSFDLVALGNSLHHFEDLPALLREVKRILAPGGTFLISEMTADGQEGASLTHALYHRWESDEDRARGVYHRHTYTCQEILNIVSAAGFAVEKSFPDQEREPKLIQGVEKRVRELGQKLEAARELPEYEALAAAAVAVEESYAKNGAAFAASFAVFAKAAV